MQSKVVVATCRRGSNEPNKRKEVNNVQSLVQAIPQSKEIAVDTPLTVSEPDQTDTGEAAGLFASLLTALQARIEPRSLDAGPAPPSWVQEVTTPPQAQQGIVPAPSTAASDIASPAGVTTPIPEDGDAVPMAI